MSMLGDSEEYCFAGATIVDETGPPTQLQATGNQVVPVMHNH